MPLIPVLGRARKEDSSRPAWAIYWVPGYSGYKAKLSQRIKSWVRWHSLKLEGQEFVVIQSYTLTLRPAWATENLSQKTKEIKQLLNRTITLLITPSKSKGTHPHCVQLKSRMGSKGNSSDYKCTALQTNTGTPASYLKTKTRWAHNASTGELKRRGSRGLPGQPVWHNQKAPRSTKDLVSKN